MVMRINGLGQGPLADRRLLGEPQQRGKDTEEGPPRQHDEDCVERRPGPSEQQRASVAALNSAIRESEDALAVTAVAAQGLQRAEELLFGLEQRLQGPFEAPAAQGAAPQIVAAEGTVPEGVAPQDAPEGVPPATPGPAGWLTEALAGLNEIADTTRFGPQRLLDGSLGCAGVAVGDGLEFVAAAADTRSSPPQGYEVLLSEEPVRATALGERPLTAERIAAGIRLRLREGGAQADYRTRPGESPREVVAALQAMAQREGLALLVDMTEDGRLMVQHRLFGATHRFGVVSSTPGVLSTPEGSPRIVANGRDIAGTLHGEPARGQGQTLQGLLSNVATAGLTVRYTGLPYTGATYRLPRRAPAILDPRVFAGRVVVAQQALTFRLGHEAGDAVHLRLDSVRPEHLARGIDTPSEFSSLAALRVGTAAEWRDARLLATQALGAVCQQRKAVEQLSRERLAARLARLRVQAQNVAAAAPELRAPGAAMLAVRALSLELVREARSALTAQSHPPQGSLLELLGGEQKDSRGPRWN